MRILLIVPDGVGVRNYLYSSFVEELESLGNDIILYHQISENALEEINKVNTGFKVIKRIPFYEEDFKSRFLRESLMYARLLRNAKTLKNKTILRFWNKDSSSIKKKIYLKAILTSGWLLSKSNRFLTLSDKLFEQNVLKGKFTKNVICDLKLINPDVILNLNPRMPNTAPIISAAKALNIVTTTVIYSWDNVPKGQLISRYDKYLVWSKLMKEDLCKLYKEINCESVVVVGTPQFEFYFHGKFSISKEVFFKRYGLDINRNTICFSANDLSSPYEPNYLNDLCEEIMKIEEKFRPQILFRKCPVEISKRFDFLLEKYENILCSIAPDWTNSADDNGRFADIYPKYNDLYLLYNTVKYCDLVINLGSTMAHDFAVMNKPCLYLNYDPVETSTFTVDEIYKFQHFSSMKDLDAVVWVNSKNEISDVVQKVIAEPEKYAKDKKIWMERIVLHPLVDNSKRLARILTQEINADGRR